MTKLKMTRLGDLFEITSSKRVHKEDWQTAGVPFLRAREIVQLFQTGAVRQELYITEEMYSQFKSKYGVPQPDDLLVTGVGTLGICYRVRDDSPFYFKDGNIIWLKKRHDEDSRYIEYAFQSDIVRDQIMEGSQGATVGTYTIEKANETLIPLPPLPEQQRIVTKLDAAFGALREAEGHVERNRANARELFESYLNGVFEGREGWEETTLGEIGKVCMCKRILKEQTTATGDIPFYKIGTFGKEPDAFIPKEIYEEFKRKYSYPKKGDVLISASGTIGRGVVYDGEPAYFQDSNIVWIDNNEEQVLNEYLYQFYKVCDWSPTKGATISRLYNDDLRKVRIAFPSLQEQRKLVAQMVEIDAQTKALEATYQQKLRELEGLKKGLLGSAFRGEL